MPKLRDPDDVTPSDLVVDAVRHYKAVADDHTVYAVRMTFPNWLLAVTWAWTNGITAQCTIAAPPADLTATLAGPAEIWYTFGEPGPGD